MPTDLNLNDLIPAVIAAVAAAGGYGASRLQSKAPNPASPGGGDGGEVLRAVQSVELKIDLLGQKVSSVNYMVNGLANDINEAKQDIVKLKRLEPHVEEIHGRLVVLESRAATNQSKGQI